LYDDVIYYLYKGVSVSGSSSVLLEVAFGKTSIFVEANLGMAKWTVLELQVLQLPVESLVLADFAGVVLLLEDAGTTCNAWAVVRAALLAGDIAVNKTRMRNVRERVLTTR
jgi:hypothetical protein